jgi:tRNA threonylcarbamoyladenosine biosynthesis protein TsaE
MIITVKDKRHLHQAAKTFLEYTKGKKIFAFYGAMGAGKTTFIKAVCETIGTSDIVSSPTFTLVNEYKSLHGGSIYHIDFYRIKKLEEVFDFGVEEYLSGDSYCFIEWPELAAEILPAGTENVKITASDDGTRTIEIS